MIAIAVPTVDTVLECTHHLACSVLVIGRAKAQETVWLRSGHTDDPGSKIVDRRVFMAFRGPQVLLNSCGNRPEHPAIESHAVGCLGGAAAAGFVLATGLAGWLFLNSRGGVEPITTEIRTQLDLRPCALMRGEAPQGDQPRLILPRARAVLTLLLPTGSEPGPYEVEIRDSSGVSKASAKGDASLRNQVTTLDVAADFSSLTPGAYQLAVRRGGEHWQLFPVQVQ